MHFALRTRVCSERKGRTLKWCEYQLQEFSFREEKVRCLLLSVTLLLFCLFVYLSSCHQIQVAPGNAGSNPVGGMGVRLL
jgi:hypothetical protein